MKNFIFISFLLILNCAAGQVDDRIISSDFEFEKGSTELMYGDKVVLREKPSSTSEALDTLSIGQKVKIVEKSNELMKINGQDSPWYKIKVNGKTGFVLGGLIALNHKEINGKTYVVTTAFHDEQYYVRARVITKDKQYYGHETRLNTNAFTIQVYGNRGITGIEDMLKIKLFAEACGVDGGEFYLFNDGKQLIEAIHLAVVGDGGVFWFDESIVFPTDEDGREGMVMYSREHGELMSGEIDWYKTIIHTLPLEWKDGAFYPDVSTFEFDKEVEY